MLCWALSSKAGSFVGFGETAVWLIVAGLWLRLLQCYSWYSCWVGRLCNMWHELEAQGPPMYTDKSGPTPTTWGEPLQYNQSHQGSTGSIPPCSMETCLKPKKGQVLRRFWLGSSEKYIHQSHRTCNSTYNRLTKSPDLASPSTIGALIIRIGFRGILYHTYNKEPQNNIGNY